MVELEAGQVWRPTLPVNGYRCRRVIERLEGEKVVYRNGRNQRRYSTLRDWQKWASAGDAELLTRHGARLVTDDGAGGEG